MSFLSLISGFMQGASAWAGADTDAQNAEERARVNDFNAKVAEQQAKSTMEGAAADSSDFRRAQSARRAASKAAAAGQGFLLEGSPLMVDKAVMTAIEFSTDRIIGNARVNAARLRTQSSLLKREAVVERNNASLARQAGIIGAISGVTGGLTSAYSRSTLTTSPSQFF